METYENFRERKRFDYDDMKIAIATEEFYNTNKENLYNNEEDFDTYENIIDLVKEIKNEWNTQKDNNTLTREQHAYIQMFAYNYLTNKYLD